MATRKKKESEEPEDKKKKTFSQEEEDARDREFLEALMSRPYIELDNEFLLRKDFIVGICKTNNFQEDKYSILIFHEALDDSIGTIWQRECFISASPKQRDEHYARMRVELNSF